MSTISIFLKNNKKPVIIATTVLIIAIGVVLVIVLLPKPASSTSTTTKTNSTSLSTSSTSSSSSNSLQQESSPTFYTTGSGTEASPYVSTSGTGGIQEAINYMAALRAGGVVLGSNKYIISTPININSDGIKLHGDVYANSIDPDGLAPATFGTNLSLSTTNSKMVGVYFDGTRMGGTGAKNLAISGGLVDNRFIFTAAPQVTYVNRATDTTSNVGMYIRGGCDQGTWEECSINNMGIGIYMRPWSDQSNFIDTCIFRHINTDGCGYGIVCTQAVFTRITDCVCSDQYYAGVVMLNGRGSSLTNCTIVRCGGANSDPICAQVSLGSTLGASGGQLLAAVVWNHNDANNDLTIGYGSSINGCRIEDAGICWLSPSRTSPPYYQSRTTILNVHGLVLYGQDTSVTGNSFVNNSGSGVYASGLQCQFNANTFAYNALDGLDIYGNGHSITGNTIHGNGRYGIYITSANSYETMITGNHIRATITNGIYMSSTAIGYVSVTGNTIADTSLTGAGMIIVGNSTNVTISGNIFTGNGGFAIDVQSGTGIVVGANTYSNNSLNLANGGIDVHFGASCINCTLYVVKGMKYKVDSGAQVNIITLSLQNAGTYTV